MAANVLWTRAIDFQKVQEWDRLKVTVDMITKLQPHFLSIWTFQSWNLTYNVSVEWDAPEDKYEWIKRGIKFVQDGVRKNQKSPDLIWDTAWYYYHKLGFSDESIILRRLFRDDDDESFKRSPLDGGTIYHDNFQLGHDWFVKAVNLVDEGEERQHVGDAQTVEHVDAPAQRKGSRATSRSARCRPTPRPATPSAWRRRAMKGIEATFGPKAQEQWQAGLRRVGRVRQRTSSMTFNQVMVDGKLVRPRSSSTTTRRPSTTISRTTGREPPEAPPREPAVLVRPLGRPDELSLLEGPLRRRARGRRDPGPQALLRGDQGVQVGRLPAGRREVQGGAPGSGTKLLERHQPYRRDDLNKKDTGLIVKRYARACQQSQVDARPRTPRSWTSSRPTRTTSQGPLRRPGACSTYVPLRLVGSPSRAERAGGDRTDAGRATRPAPPRPFPGSNPLDLAPEACLP